MRKRGAGRVIELRGRGGRKNGVGERALEGTWRDLGREGKIRKGVEGRRMAKATPEGGES